MKIVRYAFCDALQKKSMHTITKCGLQGPPQSACDLGKNAGRNGNGRKGLDWHHICNDDKSIKRLLKSIDNERTVGSNGNSSIGTGCTTSLMRWWCAAQQTKNESGLDFMMTNNGWTE
jgi:hypothetical protein